MKNINKLIQFKPFISILVLMIFVSCTSLSPYKVPVLQGNIFEEEDIEKLSEGLTKDQVPVSYTHLTLPTILLV